MVAATKYAATVTMPSDTELVIEREFNAPRELVWEAFTKPEHVTHWYGLRGSKMDVCQIDLREGGAWRYVVSDQDGSSFAFSGTYLEVEAPQRLKSTEWFEMIPGADYVVTATYAEEGGKTKLRSHIQYKSKEHRDGHVMSGMEHGMNETFDRLDEVLARLKQA